MKRCGIKVKLDHSPVLDHLRKMEVPDSEGIGRIVSERLRRHNVATREDHQELSGHVRRIPDNVEVLEAMKNLERATDPQLVVDALRAGFPDPQLIAGVLVDKLKRTNLHMDMSEVIAAINGIRYSLAEVRRTDWNPVLQEIAKLDQTDVLRAVANVQVEMRQFRESLSTQQRVVQTVVPPTVQPAPMMKQVQTVVPQVHSYTRSASVPAVVQAAQPNVLMSSMQDTNPSPRVVAEVYGPKVNVGTFGTLRGMPTGTVRELSTATAMVAPMGTTPMATTMVTGVDMNRDGIPDVLQSSYSQVVAPTMAETVQSATWVEEKTFQSGTYTPTRSVPSPRPASPMELVQPIELIQAQAMEIGSDELSNTTRMVGEFRGARAARFPGAGQL
jgi:hypothetical protein